MFYFVTFLGNEVVRKFSAQHKSLNDIKKNGGPWAIRTPDQLIKSQP